MITAAIYRENGSVRSIVKTDVAGRMNARLRPGETWRVVPEECLTIHAEVPSLGSIDPHPELVEPE